MFIYIYCIVFSSTCWSLTLTDSCVKNRNDLAAPWCFLVFLQRAKFLFAVCKKTSKLYTCTARIFFLELANTWTVHDNF